VPVLDAVGTEWTVPDLVFQDVAEINKSLRVDPGSLKLPKTVDDYADDFHSPPVQQWFLSWPGAPVFVGCILFASRIKELGIDERGFASRWRGDAIERLRDAIWEAWTQYLPPTAREQSQGIRRTLDAQRATQAAVLIQTIEILEETRPQLIDEAARKLRKALQSRIQPTSSGDLEESSESTPEGTATASSS
jgi:hypothetical protein